MIVVHINPSGVEKVYFQSHSELMEDLSLAAWPVVRQELRRLHRKLRKATGTAFQELAKHAGSEQDSLNVNDNARMRLARSSAKLWEKEPLCEVCGKEAACSFSLIPEGKTHTWKFTGYCTADIEWGYFVEFDRCFRSMPAFIDALAHFYEKFVFDPADFFRMLHRFRKATGSYNKY